VFLAILFGGIGIHKFILGYNTEGIILLIIGLSGIFTCGITSTISFIIGVIEGIIYLTKSDEEFYETYQVRKKGWF
jgi:TM2 domain-containing membrane protein YozV